MSVDLAVLESLGINLYSNAAAVLSELVANAYDADATVATIKWKQRSDVIQVSDNGTGMTVDQINDRFLVAGYKKRDIEGLQSLKWKRPFMGRKGIGKLSVFSIANIVDVYSSPSKSVHNGLRIVLHDLEGAIKKRLPYHPTPITVPKRFEAVGTTLVLSELKTKRADLTASALRKRLARRFDVIDKTPASKGGFKIVVNDKPITFADRVELKRLEFLWEFGPNLLPDSVLPKDVVRFRLPSNVVNAAKRWKIEGWFGTAKRPTDLTDDEEAGSLKNIIVLARKRPIQEGIIEKLDFSRIFGSYVTGQIEADFLDLDGGYDDIATSDRQRLIEDDDRVVALRDFLRSAFVIAADQWSEARPKKKGTDVLARYPKLNVWLDNRPAYQRAPARKMIETIASLELEGKTEESRNELMRSGILAFERVGLRQVVTDLEAIGDFQADQLLALLGQQDSYEEGLWIDILRSRVEAINQFANLQSTNEKEKVLQKHLFNHLWLLDASWERATTDPKMEESLRKIAPGEFAMDDEGKEIRGRIDIRYATASGKHVIVELKRYLRKTDIDDLAEQGAKYAVALSQILAKTGRADEKIEVIFVLGTPPQAKNRALLSIAEYAAVRLAPCNGRYVYYDQLIHNANNQYDDYLKASLKAREIDELLGSLGSIRSSANSKNKRPAPVARKQTSTRTGPAKRAKTVKVAKRAKTVKAVKSVKKPTSAPIGRDRPSARAKPKSTR